VARIRSETYKVALNERGEEGKRVHESRYQR